MWEALSARNGLCEAFRALNRHHSHINTEADSSPNPRFPVAENRGTVRK
jgi:hypothetical protein